MSENSAVNSEPKQKVTVRGSLRLTINTTSLQVTAGSDFSIFVIIQNPFDVPITIQQVQTHIPVHFIDVNGLRLDMAKRKEKTKSYPLFRRVYESVKYELFASKSHVGIAVAVGVGVGTDFDLTAERDPIKTVQLQPGDSIVKQFVIRTRDWLFFTPLTHRFQIQVNYTIDGVDHTETTAYEQSIRSTMSAMAIGAACGAILGTLLKCLSSSPVASVSDPSVFRALIVSVLGGFAVVIAFARKSTAQPIVSVEDFWGGALIGFTVGYLGFDQFSGLFGSAPTQ